METGIYQDSDFALQKSLPKAPPAVGGSCLLKDDIKRELLRGNIKIYPFNKELLRAASYDVTLGEDFMVQPKIQNPGSIAANIWSNTQTFGLNTITAKDMWIPKSAEVETMTIRGKDQTVKALYLEPKEMVLGHTQEFVGTTEKFAVLLTTRSSVARNCIFTCQCSFFGNPGFFDRWTLEITNNSFMYKIPIVVGESLSSMVFFKTSGCDEIQNSLLGEDCEPLPSDEELEKILNSEEFKQKHYTKIVSDWSSSKMMSKLSMPS